MDIRSVTNVVQPGLGASTKNLSGLEPSALAAKPAAAPVGASAAVQQSEAVPNMEQLTQAVDEINKSLRKLSQNLEFSVDKDSSRTIIKVIDQQTHEVIRQMPSKEALEIAKALDKLQGLLLKSKA